MAHPSKGIPRTLIDMHGAKIQWTTHEGIALNLSQKLLNSMNANVRYIRDQNNHVFRQANMATDFLAEASCGQSMEYFCVTQVPVPLRGILRTDHLELPHFRS